jgi:hypothetical protein
MTIHECGSFTFKPQNWCMIHGLTARRNMHPCRQTDCHKSVKPRAQNLVVIGQLSRLFFLGRFSAAS